MSHHEQGQGTQQQGKQQGKQGDSRKVQETVEREGLDPLDGGQGWRPPAEGGDAAPADQGVSATGVYDSGQGSRPSTEGGEEEEGMETKDPWNG